MTGSRRESKLRHAGSLKVAEVGLGVCVALNLMVIPLPQPSECKGYRHEPSHSRPQSLVLAALTGRQALTPFEDSASQT